ncbi:hypothetical protein CRG98_028857 [Punica granatum]|uniref:Uncharacterized protein n=1 Tax=Punica granatum TaxID=22663 RepID=A0A2I0J3A8_PUNGR|nr:hypothetical protein CRG98_028857 [Punica granatum]
MHTVTKRSPSYGSGVSRHFTDTTTWRAFIASSPARSTAVFSLFLFLLAGAFLTSRLLDATSVTKGDSSTLLFLLLTTAAANHGALLWLVPGLSHFPSALVPLIESCLAPSQFAKRPSS